MICVNNDGTFLPVTRLSLSLSLPPFHGSGGGGMGIAAISSVTSYGSYGSVESWSRLQSQLYPQQ
jgi:hypothetical protein